MNWYKKAKGLPEGPSDKKTPGDYDKRQIEKGKKIELEHTKNRDLAQGIAMDHLEEHPTYYTELDKMEGKLEKKKPARRGRYPGQTQGDEYRPGDSAFSERLTENDLVEGAEVKKLNALARQGNWDGFNLYVEKLKREGHSLSRVQSMMTRAMHGVRL